MRKAIIEHGYVPCKSHGSHSSASSKRWSIELIVASFEDKAVAAVFCIAVVSTRLHVESALRSTVELFDLDLCNGDAIDFALHSRE